MSNCYHTGLPTAMCGHCNGTHAVEAEFQGRRRESDEPRLAKMRGKVEWRGIGRNLVAEHATRSALEGRELSRLVERAIAPDGGVVMNLGLPKGSCVRESGFSAWSREQSARTLAGIFRGKG